MIPVYRDIEWTDLRLVLILAFSLTAAVLPSCRTSTSMTVEFTRADSAALEAQYQYGRYPGSAAAARYERQKNCSARQEG